MSSVHKQTEEFPKRLRTMTDEYRRMLQFVQGMSHVGVKTGHDIAAFRDFLGQQANKAERATASFLQKPSIREALSNVDLGLLGQGRDVVDCAPNIKPNHNSK
jgi:DNA-directed RNA polymerase sigma subunit (sigma70/sigma32)